MYRDNILNRFLIKKQGQDLYSSASIRRGKAVRETGDGAYLGNLPGGRWEIIERWEMGDWEN